MVEPLHSCFQRSDAPLNPFLFLLISFNLELIQNTFTAYSVEKRESHAVLFAIARTWNHDPLVSHDSFDDPSNDCPDGKLTRSFTPTNMANTDDSNFHNFDLLG